MVYALGSHFINQNVRGMALSVTTVSSTERVHRAAYRSGTTALGANAVGFDLISADLAATARQ